MEDNTVHRGVDNEENLNDTELLRKAVTASVDVDEIIRKQRERQAEALHTHFPHLPFIVVELALSQCDYLEDAAALKLTEEKFLDSCGALRCIQKKKKKAGDDDYEDSATEQSDDEDDEQDGDDGDDDNHHKHSGGSHPRKANTTKFLPLAVALQDTTNMEGWSDARKEAWHKKKRCENAYYYRFNKDGETTRNGPWTSAEKQQFLTRLKEFDIQGKGLYQWGLFSVPIVGRVGYQCSGFYRKLVKSGEIHDDNYYTENGKLKFRKPEPNKTPKPPTDKVKRRRTRDVRDGDDEPQEYDPSRHVNRRDISKAGPLDEYINPIPNAVDPITQDVMQYPALSPSGYVMDLSTWKKCVLEKGICPFTRLPVKFEDVIILTQSNIDELRPKIINTQLIVALGQRTLLALCKT